MKHIYLLVLLLLQVAAAYSIPARPGQWKILTLTDGTQVKAELKGDEYMHYWLSENGDCYSETTKAGIYQLTNQSILLNSAQQKRAMHGANKSRTRAVIGGKHEPYIGKKKGLIILVDFQNKKFKDEHTNELYNDILNKVGFTSELGFKGSV